MPILIYVTINTKMVPNAQTNFLNECLRINCCYAAILNRKLLIFNMPILKYIII